MPRIQNRSAASSLGGKVSIYVAAAAVAATALGSITVLHAGAHRRRPGQRLPAVCGLLRLGQRRRLVVVGTGDGYATELLNQVEPLLGDSHRLLHEMLDAMDIVTYSAACARLVEILGLLALSSRRVDPALEERAVAALVALLANHPGAARPPSDLFVVSLIPPVIAVARGDRDVAVSFMRELIAARASS